MIKWRKIVLLIRECGLITSKTSQIIIFKITSFAASYFVRMLIERNAVQKRMTHFAFLN